MRTSYFQFGRRVRAGVFAMLYAALVMLPAATISGGSVYANHQGPGQPPTPPTLKSWVCKYVGKPGVDEKLKNGNDGLVWVDANATQGSWFKDGQNYSYVLLANAPHNPKPDSKNCPAPHGPDTIPLPTPSVNDPCGLSNAAWILPADTDMFTWSLVNGKLSVSAAYGYIFDSQEMTHDYGYAPDSGELCQKEAPTQAPIIFKDVCGTAFDSYKIPAVEGVKYYVNGHYKAPGTHFTHGNLQVTITAQAKSGYVLVGETEWTLEFTNTPCVVPTQAPAPTVDTDACGTENDTYTIPQVTGVYYKVNGHYKAPGTYSTNGATKLEIKAYALPGYKLVGKDCWKLVFTDEECVEVVTTATPVTPLLLCDVLESGITLPTVQGIEYSAERVGTHITITAKALEGYSLGDSQSVWEFDVELCPVEATEPTKTVVCGANNDTVTLPEVEHVTYAQTGWFNGENTITATVDDGYYVAGTEGDAEMSWVLADTNTICPQVLGDTTDTPNTPVVQAATTTLEDTGVNTTLATYLSMTLLGFAVMAFMQNDRNFAFAKYGRKVVRRVGKLLDEPFTLPL